MRRGAAGCARDTPRGVSVEAVMGIRGGAAVAHIVVYNNFFLKRNLKLVGKKERKEGSKPN